MKINKLYFLLIIFNVFAENKELINKQKYGFINLVKTNKLYSLAIFFSAFGAISKFIIIRRENKNKINSVRESKINSVRESKINDLIENGIHENDYEIVNISKNENNIEYKINIKNEEILKYRDKLSIFFDLENFKKDFKKKFTEFEEVVLDSLKNSILQKNLKKMIYEICEKSVRNSMTGEIIENLKKERILKIKLFKQNQNIEEIFLNEDEEKNIAIKENEKVEVFENDKKIFEYRNNDHENKKLQWEEKKGPCPFEDRDKKRNQSVFKEPFTLNMDNSFKVIVEIKNKPYKKFNEKFNKEFNQNDIDDFKNNNYDEKNFFHRKINDGIEEFLSEAKDLYSGIHLKMQFGKYAYKRLFMFADGYMDYLNPKNSKNLKTIEDAVKENLYYPYFYLDQEKDHNKFTIFIRKVKESLDKNNLQMPTILNDFLKIENIKKYLTLERNNNFKEKLNFNFLNNNLKIEFKHK